jgi:hypothetical protein
MGRRPVAPAVETGDEDKPTKALIDQAKAAAVRREEIVAAGWTRAMETLDGRAMVYDVLVNRMGLFMSPNHGSDHQVAVNLGKHELALELREFLKLNYPVEYLLMMKEND